MKMPTKLITTLMTGIVATLIFAGCGFIPNPTAPQPDEPTAAPAAATQAPQPTPTAISGTGASSGQPAAPSPTVMVNQGHSVKQWSSPPPMTVDPASSYTAVLNTSAGSITVELLAGEAPNTVNNFVFLARQGFYDNVIFHRTIEGS